MTPTSRLAWLARAMRVTPTSTALRAKRTCVTRLVASSGSSLNEVSGIDGVERGVDKVDAAAEERIDRPEAAEVRAFGVQPMRGVSRRFEGVDKPVGERHQGFEAMPGFVLRKGGFGPPAIDGARLNVQRLRELGLVHAELRVEFVDACGEAG
jgi:hypothetical protein